MSGPRRTEIAYDYDGCPTLADFAKSDAFMRGIVGPFGSGKSSASVIEVARRGRNQAPLVDGKRRTRFAVIRNTFPQLQDTTMKTFFDWMPPKHFGDYVAGEHTYYIRRWGNIGIEIEVMFRALDTPESVRKLLSLDLTGAWVNEAREIPWQIIEAVQGRVGRYPSQRDGGPTWHGVWMDTNPPDVESEWYKFFEETEHPPGFAKVFRQPSGLSPEAENLSNLPGGRKYYSNLAVGKAKNWVDVYIHGRYGFVQSGKAVFPEFIDQIHTKEIEPIPGLPVYRGWDFGLCYDDQTEVLTDGGWKLFKDVDDKVDLAATRNPETGEMSYTKINFKVARDYKGEMLEWASSEVNFCVTPEHRVPFTFRDSPGKVHFREAQWLAENMGGHHYVDLTSTWSPGTFSLEEMAKAELYGLYLAEGSVDGNRVTIYQKSQRDDMQRILDASGLPWVWYGEGTKASGWRVTDRKLAENLAPLGKARTKRVPSWIKSLHPSCLKAFVLAYTMGDGHIRKRANGSVEHTIFTTSKGMADDFQEIAQKAGWSSSIRIVKPQISVMDGRKIKNGGGFSITFKKSATRAELLKKNFRRIQYDGKIYCLNVPFHTLYVRRNGKPHWNGNTPACSFSQVLPDGRWLVFDELYSESSGIEAFADAVIRYSANVFEKQPRFIDVGDPAGMQRSQTDEKTCYGIMHAMGIEIEPGIQTMAMRLEAIRKPLTTMVGGMPQFILHPRCKTLRKALLGLYRYRRMRVTGERYTDQPEKNQVSHIMDSLQYQATRIFASNLLMSREQQLAARTEGEYRQQLGGNAEQFEVDNETRNEITGY